MERSRVKVKKKKEGAASGVAGVSDNRKVIGLWTSRCAITSKRCGLQATATGWLARTGSVGRGPLAW